MRVSRAAQAPEGAERSRDGAEVVATLALETDHLSDDTSRG